MALKRLQEAAALDSTAVSLRQQVLLVAQPDLSSCGQVAASLAQSAELTLRVYSLLVQAFMLELTSSAGAAAAEIQGRAAGLATGQVQRAGGVNRGGRGGRGRRSAGRGQPAASAAAIKTKVGMLYRVPEVVGQGNYSFGVGALTAWHSFGSSTGMPAVAVTATRHHVLLPAACLACLIQPTCAQASICPCGTWTTHHAPKKPNILVRFGFHTRTT